MDNDNNHILKIPSFKPDQDFAGLRKRGLDYIQALSKNIWTDYNEHDPGITILEALCYAITELGYRTSFKMKDLLSDKNGSIPSSQTFFSAKNILTQSPLNIDDYRKILIDVPGVQNAWLKAYASPSQPNTLPLAEEQLFADCKAEILTYEQTEYPVNISGLYDVWLDLDNDPQLGDLNNGEVDVTLYLTSPSAGTLSLTIILPAWNQVTDISLFNNSVPIPDAVITFPDAGNSLNIQLLYNSSGLNGSISVNTQSSGVNLSISDIQELFTKVGPGLTNNVLAQKVFLIYLKKIQKARQIVQNAMRKLYGQRNLCEDFVCINTIRDEEIAFCFDVDVTSLADINSIQAKIDFTIDNYLDPPVNFYLLKEMLGRKNSLNENYSIDEIFDGPKLQHGFIDTAELEKANLVTEIYASQIISLVMHIDGVVGVRNFRMTAYDNDAPIPNQTGLSWCLDVKDGYKPILSEEKSKITFYKNQIPYLPDRGQSKQLLSQLLSEQERSKLTSTADDLPLPTGTWYALDEYTSVQYLFPLTYGIGDAGLPSSAPASRQAQAKQLKAYLLFFDQVLADFLCQLKNAKHLFSTDDIKQTYYAQFLTNFKDDELIYAKKSGDFVLQKDVLSVQDSTIVLPDPVNGWENLYEPNETFIDRRNRFLDHLMARFAESFNDYAFLLYSLDDATQKETEIDPVDLITSKIEFLKNYPQTSYDRAKAYNYCPLDDNYEQVESNLWNSDNVSGLEKRLSLLGGFKDCPPAGDIITTTDTPAKFQYCLRNADGNILTSVATYDTIDSANTALRDFWFLIKEATHFFVKSDAGSNWFLSVKDNAGNEVATSNPFALQSDAVTSENRFIDAINIKSYRRKFLKCIGTGENIKLIIETRSALSGIQYIFKLELAPLTFSSSNYSSLASLNADLIQLLTASGIVKSNYNQTAGIVTINLNSGALQSNSFPDNAAADSAIGDFIGELTSDCLCEGMYLLEHILLRPRNDDYFLPPICINKECETCGEDDPYSFRISIILPYWLSHFNNMNFRSYFESLARQEVPAHCMVKVCWINQAAMLQFELYYFFWIQAMSAYYSNKSGENSIFLHEANDNLIKSLYSLHSEYPIATLHDCDESKDTNPVILGKTVLGTINK